LTPLLWGLATLLVLVVLLLFVPRVLLRRAQNRLAHRILESDREKHRLLTRAELTVSRYRRLPGVLALTEGAVEFRSLFGESIPIPTSRIAKIETGQRLSSGRRLFRLEVLRLTRASGEVLEFVLSPASAFAWRSHLGLWAVRERQADADSVVPGRPRA
jgi:hypothetical protein